MEVTRLKIEKALTPAEVDAVLAAADSRLAEANPVRQRAGLFAWVALTTGLRVSELARLCWEWFDFERKLLRVFRHKKQGPDWQKGVPYSGAVEDVVNLMAPMLGSHNEVLRVAALRDVDQIVCRKDDKKRGFVAGETYSITSQTTTITEYGERQVLCNKRDSRTGKIVPEIKTQDIMIERKAIQFTIGGEEFIVSNEKDAGLICYLVEHFELPEVHTVAELEPEKFQYCCDRIRQVVGRYSIAD